MEDAIERPQPNHCSRHNDESLKYAFDAGFVTGAHPSDTPHADDDGGDDSSWSSDSASSSDSEGESDGLTASFRAFSESMLRMERAELEMVKAREASRLAAEKRRAELENELTQMVMRTELQIASHVSRASSSRKRKRSDEDSDASKSAREGGAMLLSLLQCNLMI